MATYKTADAFRSALESRLLSAARDGGRPVGPSRKLISFSRLVARLIVSAPNDWALKGGFALELRLGNLARTTRDIDIDWRNSIDDATFALTTASRVELNDFFVFQVERAKSASHDEGHSFKFRAQALVAGRIFEELTIDVGIGQKQFSPIELLSTPDLLEFAGIPPAKVPAVPLEQHFADKLHAYSQRYRNNSPSSRPKDLVDMVLISMLTPFKADRLFYVISEVFANRNTPEVLNRLPKPPEDWERAYGALAREVGIDENPIAGYSTVSGFIDPVLSGQTTSEWHWDQTRAEWTDRVESDITAAATVKAK